MVQTLGSKTFQYQEEQKQICIPLVAASESGEAQTLVAILEGCTAVISFYYEKSYKLYD